MIEKLLQRLNGLHPMNELLTEKIRSIASITDHPRKTYVLQEGQVCKSACLVLEGLTRSYYVNEGREITSRFMDEGAIITSWMSYYEQRPGNEFIETLEDTVLACISYKDIQQLYREFPEFNIISRKQVEHAFYLAEKRTQMLRKHTAEEKYKFFIDNHPTLLQKVALKHIATYLGMSEETFSRIRSRYHKNEKG
jgi:CRP/FNR family transcriptional regulator, anaerobic regulatory protein